MCSYPMLYPIIKNIEKRPSKLLSLLVLKFDFQIKKYQIYLLCFLRSAITDAPAH